ncbi:MAG: hypothetical protein OXM56_11135 [Gammaproteobacteria bacterium]|nr:hypothetical protein [Gammaproteobacteria bacterium]
MDTNGVVGLYDYLDRLSGASCILPFERLRELTGLELPEAANSEAWWTDSSGWDAWPPSGVCRCAGWRIESVHASARLVRLRRC